jgi:lipoprotein-releasing system permease protein
VNLPVFIAGRIKKPGSGTFSSMIHQIAVLNVAIGLGIMIVAIIIMVGFKRTIRDKVASFNGHLQITKYTASSTFEELPIPSSDSSIQVVARLPFVEHIQGVAHKMALIKVGDEIQGVEFKGIGPDFDTIRFRDNLVGGRYLQFADTTNYQELIISQKIATLLEIGLNDEILIYFIQNPVRVRRLRICGIYNSGMEDFDEKIIFGHIRIIQQLNDWRPELAGTYEVFVNNVHQLSEDEKILFELTGYDLFVDNMKDKYAELFDWLSLIDRNVTILIIPLLSVVSFNMVSILIILIMERIQMIGLLKALGATSRQIHRIFWVNGIRLIFQGMVWGNVIGIGFGLLQSHFKVIPLDPENYYMPFVPIYWDWAGIAGLNLLVLGIVSMTLYLPTLMVTRLQPVNAIRFD